MNMLIKVDPDLLWRHDEFGPGFNKTIWFAYPGFPPIMSLRYSLQSKTQFTTVDDASYDAVVMLEISSQLQRWFDHQSAHDKMSILAAVEEAKASGYCPPYCTEECMEDDG